MGRVLIDDESRCGGVCREHQDFGSGREGEEETRTVTITITRTTRVTTDMTFTLAICLDTLGLDLRRR